MLRILLLKSGCHYYLSGRFERRPAAIIKADKAGIPVITVDVAAEGVPVVSHVATDNYAGGVEAGKLMGKLLNGKGTVAIISYPALQSVVARVDGFKKGLSDTPDIKIVAEQLVLRGLKR